MGFKILVVDDEKDLRDLLRIFLDKEGYEAQVAAGGDEALKKIQSWNPDLVITDIRMPQGDGFSLIQNISEILPGALPVLVMSGHVGMEAPQFQENPNFAGVMSKPVSCRDLLQAVRLIENSPH